MKKRSNALFNTIIATTVAAPLLLSSSPIAAQSLVFFDVNEKTVGYTDIIELAERKIINGHADGTFRPKDNISREHVSALLYRLLELDAPSNYKEVLKQYHDVNEDHPYAKEIAAVTEANIFNGFNGLFRGNDLISREEIASVLVRAFNLPTNPDADVFLIDLGDIHTVHRNHVEILAQHGISTGRVDQRGNYYYDGKAHATRGEFSILLNRSYKIYNTLNPTDTSSHVIGTIEDTYVELDGVKYTYSDELSTFFSTNNRDALSGSEIQVQTSDGVVTDVVYLHLNKNDHSNDKLYFNGGGYTLDGSVYIEGNHIELTNIEITQDLTFTPSVLSITTNQVKVDGYTFMLEAELSSSSSVADTREIKFINSTFSNVETFSKIASIDITDQSYIQSFVIFEDTSINLASDSIIEFFAASGSTKNVEINGDLNSVIVSSGNDIEITGHMSTDEVHVNTSATVHLNTTGFAKQLSNASPNTRIKLGPSIQIEELLLADDSVLTDVILNYDETKNAIGSINNGRPDNPERNLTDMEIQDLQVHYNRNGTTTFSGKAVGAQSIQVEVNTGYMSYGVGPFPIQSDGSFQFNLRTSLSNYFYVMAIIDDEQVSYIETQHTNLSDYDIDDYESYRLGSELNSAYSWLENHYEGRVPQDYYLALKTAFEKADNLASSSNATDQELELALIELENALTNYWDNL